jgi:hypothetical protein
MKVKSSTVLEFLLVAVVAIGCFFTRAYVNREMQTSKAKYKYVDERLSLEGAMKDGAVLQEIAVRYKAKSGVYPPPSVISNLYSRASGSSLKFNLCTNEPGEPEVIDSRITQTEDGSGGWYYNSLDGRIAINLTNRYFVASNNWVVLSEIRFQPVLLVPMHGTGHYSFLGENPNPLNDIIRDYVEYLLREKTNGAPK